MKDVVLLIDDSTALQNADNYNQVNHKVRIERHDLLDPHLDNNAVNPTLDG